MKFLKLDPESYRQNALIVSLRFILLPLIALFCFFATIYFTGGVIDSALGGFASLAMFIAFFFFAVCIFPFFLVIFPIKDPAFSNRLCYFIFALTVIICAIFSLTMLPQGTTYYVNNSGGLHYPANIIEFYVIYIIPSFCIFAALAKREKALFAQLSGVLFINYVIFFIATHTAINIDVYECNFSPAAEIHVELFPAKAICLFISYALLIPCTSFYLCSVYIKKVYKLKSNNQLLITVGLYILTFLVRILGLYSFDGQHYFLRVYDVYMVLIFITLPYLVLTLQIGLSFLCHPLYFSFSSKTNKKIYAIAVAFSVIAVSAISLDRFDQIQKRQSMLNHPVSLNKHKSSVVELLDNNGSFFNIQTHDLKSDC